MPFCENCGNKLDNDAAFCPNCGTPNSLSKNNTSKNLSSHQKEQTELNRESNNAAKDKTLQEESGKYGMNPTSLKQGFILDNRYNIKAKLGTGGFGTVYKAFDNNMDCLKAIKVIHSEFYEDKEVIADLKREAKLLMKLQSDKIVRLWDIHLNGEIKFIDMEYIDGGDLVDLKLSYPNKKVPEKEVKELAIQIADGMQQIHSHKIIHKDLKPQNVMLTKSGTVKIMDFGISETFRSSMSRIKETSRSGTPAYMSPEQLIGKDVGNESDVWSFGVMLYELLSGKQFYSGQSYSDVLMQIERKQFKPISKISEKLNSLIQNCLQYNYKERFRDFTEIKNYLSEWRGAKTEENKSINIKKTNKKKDNDYNKMIFIQGGTFQMGATAEDMANTGCFDALTHSVKVNDFYLGKYPVTQKQWNEILDINPSTFIGDDLPVNYVSWYDAVDFCNEKSKKEGLAQCYKINKNKHDVNNLNKSDVFKWIVTCDFNKNGYRLPTEAEWEYACRGGINSEGYIYSGSDHIDQVAWYSKNSGVKFMFFGGEPSVVGLKKPNELGLYDMSGNVREWCYDWFDEKYYKSSSKNNPHGADQGRYRIFRGGSWFDGANVSRCTNRNNFNIGPGELSNDNGFRLARSAK